ncbi:hypothetical protein CCP3SC5AM1_320009 [Gammaproteobacteria bacterium]
MKKSSASPKNPTLRTGGKEGRFSPSLGYTSLAIQRKVVDKQDFQIESITVGVTQLNFNCLISMESHQIGI